MCLVEPCDARTEGVIEEGKPAIAKIHRIIKQVTPLLKPLLVPVAGAVATWVKSQLAATALTAAVTKAVVGVGIAEAVRRAALWLSEVADAPVEEESR